MADDASVHAPATADELDQSSVAPTSDGPVTTPPAEASEAAPTTEGASKEPVDNAPAPQTNGASASKKEKPKPTGSTAEPKNKKLNRKQSKIDLNLEVQPGELWLAVMKGYKNWPCIICDEEMLPETLLSKRPVSAMRPDGTYREDFQTGGKNARDRRYPIMFLGTNEFAWHVNTDLRAITVAECKATIEEHEKKPLQPKTLWNAYQVAAEGHDLPYFKTMLAEHEETQIAAAQAAAEEERKREEAEAKKVEEDTEMPDADGEAKPKKEKKRKAPKEEVDEEGKPLKTPKKIKIKPPQEKETPAESASKPKKSKKKEEKPPASPVKAVVQETPEEAHEKMQKTILFLRHRLQKGFLSRDKPPEESEMPGMHQHMKTLENYSDLEGSIIRTTKINKVLKAIIKLATIPREHEFQFKKRAQDILGSWGKQLEEPASTPAAASATTNGINGDEKEKPSDEAKPAEDAEKPAEPAAVEEPKKDDTPAEPPATESKPEEPIASVEPTPA